MNKKLLFAIATLILLGGIYAAYQYWQNSHPAPETKQAQLPPPPPAAPPEPPARQVIETPPAAPPLPKLEQSDSFALDAISGLVANGSLMKLIHAQRLINNIVATIDNLPQQRVPANIMPFDPPSGHFVVTSSGADLTINSRNANRYASYVSLAGAVDAKQLVELYVRLYPLFQQSYEELGYPKRYFNDRLIEAIDDLLDTPDVKEPIQLVQPKYFYLYADPDLEASSIGQKIMIRLGSKNRKIVKNKLLEIKQELSQHMQDIKAGKAD
ncbi:DUF3014 domain-containing protein [Sideroxydans lithotrophicus]|uniref:DUF3014 domain-containing protein n=1 Tax=Sideroxydans lithotrophicus (strain ES-1) TaxID=580332 RepID=D5CLX5_SIDLE|nr:DUF3014 domain-containing protein [Sideroxydans lithotrophicus]ADE12570.1 conserved hypothetical protein [Sideroxydans lithotrophicus ES-1]